MFTPNFAKVGQALQKLKRGNAKMHTDAAMTSEDRDFFFRKTRSLKIFFFFALPYCEPNKVQIQGYSK